MLGSLWPNKDDKPREQTTDKSTEIRKLAGTSDFSSVAASAPSDTSDTVATPASSRPASGRRGRQPVQPSQPVQPQNSKDAEAEARRNAALAKIGASMMKDTAAMPYEVWAFVAHDPSLRLSADEEKELAEAYALCAEYIAAGKAMPAWIVLPLFIAGRNAKLIKTRVQAMAEKDFKGQAAIDAIEKAKQPVK